MLQVSQPVRISVPLERVPQKKLLRALIFLLQLKYIPFITFISEARARRGEDTEVDPEQFQDPDNEYGLFAGMTYEQDDEEADKIYELVDQAMDSRRKARRCVLG